MKVQGRSVSAALYVSKLGQVHFPPLSFFFLISNMRFTSFKGLDVRLRGENADSVFVIGEARKAVTDEGPCGWWEGKAMTMWQELPSHYLI